MQFLLSLLRKPVLILVLLLSTQIAKTQYVTIPDTAFVSWLKNNGFAGCINGNQLDTTCPAVLNAINLSCSYTPISDLTGIQYFKNLDSLNCNRDLLTSISLLPPALKYLNCGSNYLQSISDLPPTLQYLACDNNEIFILPALPSSLIYFECSDNDIASLGILPPNLQFLYCEGNRMFSLRSFPEHLLKFDCYNNQIGYLPSLPESLIYLDCDNNLLTALPALPGNLQQLLCDHNQLTSLPALPPSLQIFWCRFNLITTLPTLPDSLRQLNCVVNQLSEIPLLPVNLTYFACSSNGLTSIPNLPDSLTVFDCSHNRGLMCLPPLKKIINFFFDSTAIVCLPDYGNITYSTPPLDSFPLCTAGNANGCAVYTDIKEVDDVANISIYPNPSNSKLEIELQNMPIGALQISVTDISGQVLSMENMNATGKIEMDVSVLPAGLYFLKVQSEGESWVRRFVKQ